MILEYGRASGFGVDCDICAGYQENADARTLMTTATTAAGEHRRLGHADHDAQIEASWQQRALNAEAALKAAYVEIGTQRDRIGILLGQIRDFEAEYTEDTVQRGLRRERHPQSPSSRTHRRNPQPRRKTSGRPLEQPIP
jgi:hypothetical protein